MNLFKSLLWSTSVAVVAGIVMQGCGSDGTPCCSGDAKLSDKLSESGMVQVVPEEQPNGEYIYVDRNVTVIEYVDRNVTIIEYVDRNVTVEVIKVRPDAVQSGFEDGAVLMESTIAVSAADSEDVDGEVASYRWILDDENISTEQNPTIALPETEGIHKLCLVVTDNDNLISRESCKTFTIPHINQNPTAVMRGLDNNGSKIKTVCPLSVSAANSVANDGELSSYLWTIDDNQTLSGAEQNLSFQTLGTHKVCLKVTDSNMLEDEQCSMVEVFDHDAPTAVMTMKDSDGVVMTQDMNLTRSARYDFSCAGSHDDCGNETPMTCEWNAHSYKIGENGEKIDYINDCISHNNAPKIGEESWVQLCSAGADSFEYVEITLKITDQFGKSLDKVYVYGVNP